MLINSEGGCASAGKTGGAVRVCLDLFAPLFASRQKGERTERIIEAKTPLKKVLNTFIYKKEHLIY